ncbi:MAG: hypothetical protein FWE23_05350 [Chitinivibrionia bacterium]|jgi:hypothetical protein|nr:hypothetical protein [Chitinivibrionia bacterium]
MENLGYMSYDVTLSGAAGATKNKFVMPADLRPSFQGQGKFVIYSNVKLRTLTIIDEKTYTDIWEKANPVQRRSFNARPYDPKDDAQARGSFSASQMDLLGNPEYVIFSAQDKYISVQNPNTVNYGEISDVDELID